MRGYTRAAMEQAHEKGTPVMRTLFYEFPEDPVCWEVEDEYLYGADCLVAPVFEAGQRSRRVYLPSGSKWKHADTGNVYEGGRWITADAPIESIPVFWRENM